MGAAIQGGTPEIPKLLTLQSSRGVPKSGRGRGRAHVAAVLWVRPFWGCRGKASMGMVRSRSRRPRACCRNVVGAAILGETPEIPKLLTLQSSRWIQSQGVAVAARASPQCCGCDNSEGSAGVKKLLKFQNGRGVQNQGVAAAARALPQCYGCGHPGGAGVRHPWGWSDLVGRARVAAVPWVKQLWGKRRSSKVAGRSQVRAWAWPRARCRRAVGEAILGVPG